MTNQANTATTNPPKKILDEGVVEGMWCELAADTDRLNSAIVQFLSDKNLSDHVHDADQDIILKASMTALVYALSQKDNAASKTAIQKINDLYQQSKLTTCPQCNRQVPKSVLWNGLTVNGFVGNCASCAITQRGSEFAIKVMSDGDNAASKGAKAAIKLLVEHFQSTNQEVKPEEQEIYNKICE